MTETALNQEIYKKMPEAADRIIRTLNEAGYEAYAVGGCVRDCLLGKSPADWDITTSATPGQVKKLFKRTVDTGIQHGTVTVLDGYGKGNITGYEVTTYRIDGDYEDGRHPKNVQFTANLKEDLCRRDFTVNAMAYHPTEGLVDIFGGREDLEKKVIRAVGKATERFEEDALRMMRAIRFAAQLDATIEEETWDAIRELHTNIEKVSAERIRVEMEKLLVSPRPMMFRLFHESGLTSCFMPEWDLAMGTAQENPHHCYTVGDHILHSMDELDLEALKKDVPPEEYDTDVKYLRLTMLLHDIAKPQTKTIDEDGVCHFYGHPQKGVHMAEDILRRLKYDNDTIKMVCGLISVHEARWPAEPKVLRRAVCATGEQFFPLIFYVLRADTMAQSMLQREEKLERTAKLRKLYDEALANGYCMSLRELAVKGKDLLDAGMKPGPGVGDVLNHMLQDVLNEPSHNTKEYLMTAYAHRIK